MGKRNRKEIHYPKIAVFAISKGSQSIEGQHKGESYFHMLRMLEILMKKNNVISEKIAISGYKEDVASTLGSFLDMYFYRDIEIELIEDIDEFDPDIMPNNIYRRSKN